MQMPILHRLLILTISVAAISACGSLATGPVSGFAYAIPAQAMAAPSEGAKPGWSAAHFAVAAANPLATDAGYQILKAGGSAVDAAIAVQMVLGLVEPQSSGLAGGAFLLHWDGVKLLAPSPAHPASGGWRTVGGRARCPAHAGAGAQAQWATALGQPV